MTISAEQLRQEWATAPRWRGVERTYSVDDVVRLRGAIQEEHTLARRGAERLWSLLHDEDYVH
ncbi:MAG TPA: isocitrate lyase, partial [Asanoa sp.]|nr:isocitrate lyase [Asanoa sp.]